MGLDVYRQRALLRWRQLARPVPPSRTGAPLAGPAAPDQRLVNVGHADPQQCRRSTRRHAAVNRRENPRPQILRIALPLTPSHRRPQHLVSGNTESHFPSLWNPPATDSTQCGYALAAYNETLPPDERKAMIEQLAIIKQEAARYWD